MSPGKGREMQLNGQWAAGLAGWSPEGEGTDGEQAVSTHSGDRRMSRGCQCHVGSWTRSSLPVSDPRTHLAIGCPHLSVPDTSHSPCSQIKPKVPTPQTAPARLKVVFDLHSSHLPANPWKPQYSVGYGCWRASPEFSLNCIHAHQYCLPLLQALLVKLWILEFEPLLIIYGTWDKLLTLFVHRFPHLLKHLSHELPWGWNTPYKAFQQLLAPSKGPMNAPRFYVLKNWLIVTLWKHSPLQMGTD